MLLQLVFATPHLRAYQDKSRNVLFLDWQGRLTLPAVQLASVKLAQLTLAQSCQRVLINTQQVSDIGFEVPGWLVGTLLPGLHLVGVEQLAWVCDRSLHGISIAQQFLNQLLPSKASLFMDVEHAAAWLRHQPEEGAGQQEPARTATDLSRLNRLVEALIWKVSTSVARRPSWLLSEQQMH